jgi:hypothetical protein
MPVLGLEICLPDPVDTFPIQLGFEERLFAEDFSKCLSYAIFSRRVSHLSLSTSSVHLE